MTAHRRLTLRNLIVSRLIGASRAQDRVFPGRTSPLQEEDMPCLVVHTKEEMSYTIKDRSNNPSDFPPSGWGGPQLRRLTVEIEACCLAFQAQANQAIDDTGDAYANVDILAAQAEARLEAWDIPGFESSFLLLRQSETSIEVPSGTVVAVARLSYEMAYSTVYRDISEPWVAPDAGILRSGAYPGGQVITGEPPSYIGQPCPLEVAEYWLDGRKIWGPDPFRLPS